MIKAAPAIAPRVAFLSGGTPLARYDAACRAVADAKSVDEVRDIRGQAEAMRAYARQAKNKQLEVDASEIRFRAERRIGELMAAQRGTVGLNGGTAGSGRPKIGGSKADPPKDDKPTLAEAGIDKHLADRARKLASIPEQKFETILSERRERIESENERVTVNLLDAAKNVRGTQGTGENEWYTPAEYIDLARKVLGEIDLDPASSDHAQKIVKAKKFYTVETNGLDHEWRGTVWLNPPYAQPEIGYFAEKMCEEVDAKRIAAAVMLTHNYTDTAWFQALAKFAAAICFTRGRIRFVSPEGVLAAPTQGQAFFYFGKNVAAFRATFGEVGFVCTP